MSSSRTPNPEPRVPSSSDSDLLPAIFNLLCAWRTHAEADSRVLPAENIAQLVANLLNNLLGTTLTRSVSEGPLNLSADPVLPLDANPTAAEHCDNNPDPL